MPREYVLEPFRANHPLQIDYAQELNAQQHAVVTSPPGPALVIAGAGAGKTRTLVYRVAFLLEQGIPPERILLLTFTNKAAREMMGRIAELLGGDQRQLWGGTFHSIGHRLLRRYAPSVGYRKDFTILDREDSQDLVKACLSGQPAVPPGVMMPKADLLYDILSLAVNLSLPIPQLLASQFPHLEALTSQIESLARRFSARKKAANVLDFDDLQSLWLRFLQEDLEAREQCQRRFQFVLVDEYQDTNRIQGEIIDLLVERHKNVMVVGDDSQSIYSWRGANFKNILHFPQRYPEAKTFKIETNYRSTPEILRLANAAIKANTEQFAKELAPVRREGNKPVLAVLGDASQQAAFVAQRMMQLREEGIDLTKMAVLYRAHYHAMELQMELARRHIPFSITSGVRFFEQAHIKDVVACLRLVCNPADELAFRRLVKLLPGIGGRGAEKLWGEFQARINSDRVPEDDSANPAEGEPVEPSDLSTPASAHPVATALQGCASIVPKKAQLAWAEMAITVSQLETKPTRDRPWSMVAVVIEGFYDAYLKDTYANYSTRREDLDNLANFARQFQSVEDFLAQLSLLTNLEQEEAAPSSDEERVKLSTIHQAKGLEFDVVFVIMLCDGLFPSSRSLSQREDEEEERRLFYVAITRARDELYLTYPLVRMTRGNYEIQKPSRFLRELPKDLLDEWKLRSFDPYQWPI